MFSQVIPVSFEFRGWDGNTYSVDAECTTRWDEAWDEGGFAPIAATIYSMELTDLVVDGEPLSWYDGRTFVGKYFEDFKDALEWIVSNSLVSHGN